MSRLFEETGAWCSSSKRSRQKAIQKINFCWSHHGSCTPYNISLKKKKKKGWRLGIFYLVLCLSLPGLNTTALAPNAGIQMAESRNFCTCICNTVAAPPNPVAPSRPLLSALICCSSADFVLQWDPQDYSGLREYFHYLTCLIRTSFQTPFLLTRKKKSVRRSWW